MKPWLKKLILALVVVIVVVAWILHFNNALVRSAAPKWNWLQTAVGYLGQAAAPEGADDEAAENTKNEIPVHAAEIRVATLHRYVEGFGTIAPRPPRLGQMAGSANIASPAAGVVAKVLCQPGGQVHAGDVLIQLDDRLARAAEEQAQAALAQAQASLAALKATPRPDQLQIAELSVAKSKAAAELAQQSYDRLQKLATEQGTSAKSVEQAANDLAAAQADLAINQKQLDLLRTSPTPEELAQEQAKVAQAAAGLDAARSQRQLLTIRSPIDGTVVSLGVNPGESVDTTKPLVQVVAMDRLMVDVDVPADQIPAKAEGLSAEVLTSSKVAATEPGTGDDKAAVGEHPVMGTVSFVSPQVDPRSGAVMVSIDLPADTGLRPGLAVHVRIIAEEHKDCLAVPREAVVTDENGDSVICLLEDDQATHKSVKTGLEENGLIEISAESLKAGDKVVTAGAYGLPAATRVKVVE